MKLFFFIITIATLTMNASVASAKERVLKAQMVRGHLYEDCTLKGGDFPVSRMSIQYAGRPRLMYVNGELYKNHSFAVTPGDETTWIVYIWKPGDNPYDEMAHTVTLFCPRTPQPPQNTYYPDTY